MTDKNEPARPELPDLEPNFLAAEIGSVWVHKKSGAKYMVTGHGLLEYNLKPVVLYRPMLGKPVTWVRPSGEFFARFIRLTPETDTDT